MTITKNNTLNKSNQSLKQTIEHQNSSVPQDQISHRIKLKEKRAETVNSNNNKN